MILASACPKAARRLATMATMCVSLALLPRPALAQDFATKSAARKLGEEGIALFEKKQFAEALEKFNLAEQIVPAPTLGLRAARCLVQLGRFVEASERYLEVIRLTMPQNQLTPAFRKAQADAVIERDDLVPLIPSLTISVRGPLGSDPKLFVERPIDPGVHEVELQRPDTKVKKKLDIVVKQSAVIELELPPLPAPKAPPPDPRWRTVAWIGMGLGAAGTIAFAITGSLALSKQRDLVPVCPKQQCLPEFHDDVDSYDAFRYLTTASIITGVVGFGVGIPLLIVKPRIQTKKEALLPTWSPVVGPNAIGVRGTF
jgi:tetratricopeptide (TPR) repeat protein